MTCTSRIRRPALLVYTVSFLEEKDRDAEEWRLTVDLGEALYHKLTRPLDDPLAYGAGIPVRVAAHPDAVDMEAAEKVVIVAVVGGRLLQVQSQRRKAFDRMAHWDRKLGEGRVLTLPASPAWTSAVRSARQGVLGNLSDPNGKGQSNAVDEIVLALARVLRGEAGPGANDQLGDLFISHSKADLGPTGGVAEKIFDYVSTDTTGRAFFDTTCLKPGYYWEKTLLNATRSGMFIAIRGDAYSSRAWCQRELLTAKRHGVPTLTVDVLHKGEPRTLPYAGNGRAVKWSGDPAEIVSIAMVEWLKARLFEREAERLKNAEKFPDDLHVAARPPELLDFAQGPMATQGPVAVLHPDPEVSVPERAILRRAQPKLTLVTPTTLYRRVLGRNQAASETPLADFEVALSISDGANIDRPMADGLTPHHVTDAVVGIARALISAGAGLGYGGVFKLPDQPKAENYAVLLSRLIHSYNQVAALEADLLVSYLASVVPRPDDAMATVRSLRAPDTIFDGLHLPETFRQSLAPIVPRLEFASASRVERALSFSDMRRIMARMGDARVIIGGSATPKPGEGAPGYGGPYPGVAEEAWWTLRADKPLYVAGGFKGAGAAVADVMRGKPTPDELTDQVLRRGNPYFGELVDAFRHAPLRQKLGLPAQVDDLADAIREMASAKMADEKTSRRWNGLSPQENCRLLTTQDPTEVVNLILRGLLAVDRRKTGDNLEIELVHGNVLGARRLDVLVVGTYRDAELGGAVASFEPAVRRRIEDARRSGHRLVTLDDGIDAGYLYLADLGRIRDLDALPGRIEQAARETVEICLRHGFLRMGVVTFGGANALTREATLERAQRMLSAFRELEHRTTVVWYEANPKRFSFLSGWLATEQGVSISEITSLDLPSSAPAHTPSLHFDLRMEGEDTLRTSILPPAGSPLVSIRRVPLKEGTLQRFAAGQESAAPSFLDLEQWGSLVSDLLFGDEASDLLMQLRKASPRVQVVLDESASRLPVELLRIRGDDDSTFIPSKARGLVRYLAVETAPNRLAARPPRAGPLRVALAVSNDAGLPSARKEADAIQAALACVSPDPPEVEEVPATVDGIRAALVNPTYDVFHYIGHAWFGSREPKKSGLVLGQDRLTTEDLAGLEIQPRVVFLNGCQTGHLRAGSRTPAPDTTHQGSFARAMLQGGLDVFLGATWLVNDYAAGTFAGTVYEHLARGRQLEAAVTSARAELYDKKSPDWANYVLYGDGTFSLVRPASESGSTEG